MIKNITLFLSAIGLLTMCAEAQPVKCRFRSSSKCMDSVYFKKQLKEGCASQGGRCRLRFCKTNCVDAEAGLVRLCKKGCLDTATLNSFSKGEREGLYKTVLGIGSNPSQKELKRALKKERELFDYRAKRSRGWSSWFRTQPSLSENLESLVLEGKLREQYEALIRSENNKGNQKATVLALRAAAADLVPDIQEYRRKKLSEKVLKKWRARIADKRVQAVQDLADNAGVSATIAQQAASQVKVDAIKGTKPKLPEKPAHLRKVSAAHKEALKEEAAIPSAPPPPGGDYGFTAPGKVSRGSTDSGVSSGRNTPENNIPPPPPLPPAGWSPKIVKPATPVGTTEDGFTSANVIPPSSTVKQQPVDLLDALRQNNKAKLRSAKARELKDRPAPASTKGGANIQEALRYRFRNTGLNREESSDSDNDETSDWDD